MLPSSHRRAARSGRCLLVATLVLAAPQARAQSAENPAPPVVRTTLANGLKVVFAPDRRSRHVALAVAYAAGSAAAPEGHAGLPHLVEHLSFWGSRHLEPYGAVRMIDELGGSTNAQTRSEHIVYFATAPTFALERLLWLEADRMAFAIDAIDEESLAIERRVVTRELDERADDFAIELFRFRQRALYGAAHPFTPSERERRNVGVATADDARWFFQRTHRPDNATLVVAGAFDVAAARTWVERYFAPIVSPAIAPLTTEAPAPALCGEHRSRIEHNFVVYPRVRVAWVVQPEGPTDVLSLRLAALALRQRLVDGLVAAGTAEWVRAGLESHATHALLEVEIQLTRDADVDTAIDQVDAAFFDLSAAPLAPRAFRSLVGALEAALEADASPLDRSLALALGRPDPRDLLRELPELGSEDVRRVLQQSGAGRLVQTAANAPGVRGLVERRRANPCD